MKRLSYNQMVVGLDKLFFGGVLKTDSQAQDQLETIDAYLEACGWTWDDIIEEMLHEDFEDQTTTKQSSGNSNQKNVN